MASTDNPFLLTEMMNHGFGTDCWASAGATRGSSPTGQPIQRMLLRKGHS